MIVEITIEKIERETDKAILVACEVESAAGRYGRKIWFPKSRSNVEGKTLVVEDWLANAKLRDLFGDKWMMFWFN